MRLFLAAAMSGFIVASAHGVEPFRPYDSFNSTPIDLTKWQESERVRQVRRGALNLMQRSWPGTGSDAGLTFSSWSETVTNPAAITALKTKVTVDGLEVSSCTANTVVGQSRARLIGSFFNVGTPTAGSQVGDVLAQVKLVRFSDSIDPPGTLRVQGVVSVCGSADCNSNNTTIGSVVDLGTLALGTATTVQLQWDQPGKTFWFSRDAGAFSGSVGYTASDASPPSVPFKQLSTRADLPNCASGPRVSALVDATFDNVQVNQSAAP